LSAEEQLEFEEHQEQLIKEAKAKFLANFKVKEQQGHSATSDWSGVALRPTAATPKVSDTNEFQSLKAYIDEQRDQMQQIIGGMQTDFKRLVRAFDKSIVANFSSHGVKLGGNMHDSSATGCHDQIQPLYGMPINTCPGQPHSWLCLIAWLANVHGWKGNQADELKNQSKQLLGIVA
jgi:hypothetical protein